MLKNSGDMFTLFDRILVTDRLSLHDSTGHTYEQHYVAISILSKRFAVHDFLFSLNWLMRYSTVNPIAITTLLLTSSLHCF